MKTFRNFVRSAAAQEAGLDEVVLKRLAETEKKIDTRTKLTSWFSEWYPDHFGADSWRNPSPLHRQVKALWSKYLEWNEQQEVVQ